MITCVLLFAAANRTPARPVPSATPAMTTPVLISRLLPDPKDVSGKCRGSKSQGLPVIEAYIQADGTVRDVRVTRSSGCLAGDQLLEDAIKKWTYKPGTADGKPVGVWLTVTVNHFWW